MSNTYNKKRTLTDNQVKLAHDAFNALDADSSGTISAQEFMLAYKKKITEKVIQSIGITSIAENEETS
jgi:Ca2+-binding EF-hand superfamily protein